MTPEINRIFMKQLEFIERNGHKATHAELIMLEEEAYRIYRDIQTLTLGVL